MIIAPKRTARTLSPAHLLLACLAIGLVGLIFKQGIPASVSNSLDSRRIEVTSYSHGIQATAKKSHDRQKSTEVETAHPPQPPKELVDKPTTPPQQVKPQCTAHLKCQAESSLPICDMRSQSNYLKGKWSQELDAPDDSTQSPAQIASWLQTHAYEYQDRCNAGPWPCHVAEPNECRRKSLRIVSHQWIPDECTLLPFDARGLDEILGGRRVLFVGDSLMRQEFNSWRMLMEPAWRDRDEALGMSPVSANHNGKEQFHSHNGLHSVFMWSKYLVDEDALSGDSNSLQLNLKGSWPYYLEKNNVDFMVFNVGHHWHKNDVEFEKYEEMMHMVMAHLSKHFKGKAVIFRTSTPGHYGCGEKEELKNGPLAQAPVLDPQNDRFNWRKPIAAEMGWERVASEYGMTDRFRYLNVSLSQLRSDAHVDWNVRNDKRGVDCLHWCLPGVPDFWNQLLLNMLIQEEQS